MSLIKTKSFELAIYPKGNSDANKLALVLPGKLDTKDYAHMKSHVDFLASLGFFAVSFDPPGTWESPGDISLYNTTNYLKAVDELIEYFGNKPTFLMGHSRGASVAMIAGTRNPNVKAYASIMPSFSERGFDHARDEKWERDGFLISKRDLPPGGGEKIKEFKLPFSFFEDQIKYEWTDEFAKSSKPKLIVVGKQDATVPADQVREVYQLLSTPKQLYELDWNHDYRHNPLKIQEINNQVQNFLSEFKLI